MPTVSLMDVLQKYSNAFLEMLPTLVIAALVFGAFMMLAKLGKKAARNIVGRMLDDSSLQSLAGTIASVLLTVIGIFAAATIVFPGLEAGDLVGVLGLSSVAIGFAFKDIFQNFLAGILLLLQRPFVVGDQIAVGGHEGTVRSIDIRSTTMRSYNGVDIVIPNSDIYTSSVTVQTSEQKRRSIFSTGIGYGEDIDQAREVIRRAVEGCEAVLDAPSVDVLVTGHGDSSVNFDIFYWTDSQKRSEVLARDQVATAIKYALDEADIEIPYPYRTVEFFDKTERASSTSTRAEVPA